MFITNGFRPNNEFWRYILGSAAIIMCSFLGHLPLLAVIAGTAVVSGDAFPATSDNMLTYLEPNLSFFLILIPFVFAMLGIWLVTNLFHKIPLKKMITGRAQLDWKRIGFTFGLWSAFTIASTLVSYYTSPESFEFNFRPVPFAVLVVISVLLIPVQTSCEEFVFRGYLMQGFALLARNSWFPLVMTSLIFGLLHIANPEIDKMGYIVLFYYVGTGFLLGIMTLMDNGSELALGFHAANNLFTALLVTSDWSAFRTYALFKDVSAPEAGLEIFLPLLVIYPLLLLILAKKYNWSGWKEKLTGNLEPNHLLHEHDHLS